MATVNEQIVTGRKFRKLIDEVNKLWQRISFWTKASDVEFNDGKTAETKFGAINGVTDSLTSTSSNIAASAAAVKALNDKVTELSSNLQDDVYYIKGYSGADSVGAYTFKSPVSGAMYIYGCGSTKGFYVEKNGSRLWNYTAGSGSWNHAFKSVSITKGDTIKIYAQGEYLAVILKGNVVADTVFLTNL